MSQCRERVRAAAVVASAAMLLSACATTTSSGSASHLPSVASGNTRLLRADVPIARPKPGTSDASLGAGLRALGYDLVNRLEPTASDGNLAISPASLAIAFALLREGATGASAAQIDRVLHLPANRQQAINALMRSIEQPGAGNVLTVGDAAFVQRGYPVRRSYLQALQRWYGAGVYQTTFPGAGKTAVNAYVDRQTHGLIPRLITDQFNQYTVLALVNTLYLNARWEHPFDPNLTASEPFSSATHGKVDVPTMTSSASAGFAVGPGWQAVRLPYQGNRLSLWILLPSKGSPVAMLDPAVLASAGSGFTDGSVDLSLPRWSFGTDAPLDSTLKAMGLSAPFQGGLGGIANDPTLHLDSVIQQVRISVAERGTVAAAATGLGAVAESASLRTLDVNHPFAFAVMDNASGTPLFEGTVSNPAAQ